MHELIGSVDFSVKSIISTERVLVCTKRHEAADIIDESRDSLIFHKVGKSGNSYTEREKRTFPVSTPHRKKSVPTR